MAKLWAEFMPVFTSCWIFGFTRVQTDIQLRSLHKARQSWFRVYRPRRHAIPGYITWPSCGRMASSLVPESSFSPSISIPCTYVIVGDNLDKTISPRYMRSDHQKQSIHYFHMYASLDRVNAIDLPADHPVGDISTTPLTEFLPSPADCKVLLENYAVFLGHVVVKKLLFFIVFEDCVGSHVTHKHSEVMKQKSVIVSRFKLQIVNMLLSISIWGLEYTFYCMKCILL